MSSAFTHVATVGDYNPYPIAAATTAPQAAGLLLDATSNTAIAGAGTATITINQVFDGDLGQLRAGTSYIIVDTGAGVCEKVQVTGVNVPAKTITATFANAHSGTYAVRMFGKSLVGGIAWNQQGSAMTLTLYNGHPNNGGVAIATITPPANASSEGFWCGCSQGLYYTYTGTTPGNVTLFAKPVIQ